jgi:hypothetical protein
VPWPVTARARDGAESESQCPAAARLGSAGPQSLRLPESLAGAASPASPGPLTGRRPRHRDRGRLVNRGLKPCKLVYRRSRYSATCIMYWSPESLASPGPGARPTWHAGAGPAAAGACPRPGRTRRPHSICTVCVTQAQAAAPAGSGRGRPGWHHDHDDRPARGAARARRPGARGPGPATAVSLRPSTT